MSEGEYDGGWRDRVTYCDRSAIQQHSCATLFEITRRRGCDVFGCFSASVRKDLRQLCVSAILHTDSSRVFHLTNQMCSIYEAKKDLFEYVYVTRSMVRESFQAARQSFGQISLASMTSMGEDMKDPNVVAATKIHDYLWNADVKHTLRNYFVYMADQSKSLKSFELCQLWTELQYMEFFRLGDAERELRIPVPPMHDRARANIPYLVVQHTKFFVASPMVLGTRILPTLRGLEDSMWDNLERWASKWQESGPDPELQRGVLRRIEYMRARAKDQPQQILPSDNEIRVHVSPTQEIEELT